MAIPNYQTMMLPLLQLASDGQEHPRKDAMTELAEKFGLTEEESNQCLPSGAGIFSNRYGCARTYLKKAGLIHYTAWGKFQITDAGKTLLATNPEKIDIAMLKKYPEFHDFYGLPITAEDDGEDTQENTDTGESDSSETPEELISSSALTLKKLRQAELLDKIMANSPKFFERLVVRLLTTMGYGGTLADAGQVVGQSHDGGIDGIIKEDRLGLDLIYIQAKCWKGAVGSSQVQSFVGALAGRKAPRGVFITTSRFTKEALTYAKSLDSSVVLIDGEQLTSLMFEYGLGVSTEETYAVKRIDNDFFDEEEA